MKKIIGIVIMIAVICAAVPAETIESVYYSVSGDVPVERLVETGRLLDKCWAAYNSVFRFNKDGAGFKLPVTVYADKPSYDIFIREKTGQIRDNYVYLKYSRPEKSPLVIFLSDSIWNQSLIRQSYLQYIYSFIKNPPLWIREGFALYFDTLKLNEATGVVTRAENSPWLDQVKKIRTSADKSLKIQDIITAKPGMYPSADFYPQAWAAVSFMTESANRNTNRLLWDSFYQLTKNATIEENTAAAAKYIGDWTSLESLNLDFSAWLDSHKTFSELLTDGTAAYNNGDYDTAEKVFTAAMDSNPAAPVPVYYRGLIAYARGNYNEADVFYKAALQNGADTATVNWALGLSAYAAGKNADAIKYIETAQSIAPDRYRTKAAELLEQLR